MKPMQPPLAADTGGAIAALIEALHDNARRLEELTAGEVDTVADSDGRTFLLRPAQDHWRHNEAAKQAAIANALPAHIALLDVRGAIISVNEAWRAFARANALQGPEYGIGVNYLEVCDSAQGNNAAEAGQVARGIRAVLAGGAGSFSIEYACHSPTERRWFLMTVTPMADVGAYGVVVMHLDITERKEAEDSLRESKDLLQLVVEHVPSRIFWKDRDLRYLGCNTLFAKDAGLSTPEELSGKTDFEMSWKDQAELYRADDQAVLNAGAPKLDIEEPQTTPDGNTIWLHTSKVPLRNKDDGIIGVLGLYQDITARRRAEQDLRESERRFSDLLENVALVSIMLDREARITYCNDYLLRLSGWQREDVIGRNWFELFIPPEGAEMLTSFYPTLLADAADARHRENEILTRAGERRLIRWNNSVLRSGAGDVIGIASIGEDITERERAESRLRRLNRVYAVQSGINALIVRVHDRDELFREACRIAVEVGAFRTAWIGVIDPQTLDGKVVAWQGADQDYVDSITLTARGATAESEPLACRALRLGQAAISNDIATEPSLAPLRDEMLRQGTAPSDVFH
ncbi:MAG: PAS domain S-box protein [Sulfuritalea sp.]|nr:PAS domain S-box protein [Sulfuritalea sp.]